MRDVAFPIRHRHDLIAEFELGDDIALGRLARIVHAADISSGITNVGIPPKTDQTVRLRQGST